MRTESALSAVALRILLMGRGMPILVSIQALTGLRIVLQRPKAGGMLGTQELSIDCTGNWLRCTLLLRASVTVNVRLALLFDLRSGGGTASTWKCAQLQVIS